MDSPLSARALIYSSWAGRDGVPSPPFSPCFFSLFLQFLEMFASASTAQASLALLALHALGSSAHYLPPQIKPRDDSSYRMKTYGTGYKSASSSNGMSDLIIEGDDTIYSVDIILGGYGAQYPRV